MNSLSLRRRIILLLIVLPCTGLLSGCAGMNSKFDCEVNGQGMCAPLDRVNRLADQGAFNTTSENAGKISSSINETGAINTTQPSSHYAVDTPKPGEPIRYGETVQRVWIAPYQDTQGNYHEPSYVYTVVEPGHWVGVPAQEVVGNT